MKNGAYSLLFNVDGVSAVDGWASIESNTLDAGDSGLAIRAFLNERARSIDSNVNIELMKTRTSPAAITEPFVVGMFGISTEEHFELIGVGPLGIIVEISGDWLSA